MGGGREGSNYVQGRVTSVSYDNKKAVTDIISVATESVVFIVPMTKVLNSFSNTFLTLFIFPKILHFFTICTLNRKCKRISLQRISFDDTYG